MLRVYYSNQTEELLNALVNNLRGQRSHAGASLFDPTLLVVPNRNMEAYLKLAIARLMGIAAHLDVRLVSELFGGGSKDAGQGRATLQDRLLAAMFDDELLETDELSPVRDYLRSREVGPDMSDRRRVQLALKLVRLFEDYRLSRPEILDCWRAGLFVGDATSRDTESWQRWLWLHVMESAPPTTTAENGRQTETTAHVFGVSYLPRGQVYALAELSERCPVFVYTLNPCQEVWEAVSKPFALPSEPRRYERRGHDLGPGEVYSVDDPFRLSNRGEMHPLGQWGRPGREGLRMLNAVTGCELVPRIREPLPHTLLGRLQKDIVLRKPERSHPPRDVDVSDDESVVFLECANVRRELETIAATIWSLMARDVAKKDGTRLRFNDIAVILVPAEAERYQALIGSVFGELHDIPYNIVDLPLAAESRVVEAIELLLAIPLGRFTRKDLLSFVTHPVVLASLPGVEAGECVTWCETLGILRGVDRRAYADTYVQKDVFNWDQGLKRLALGSFMSGERSGDERLFTIGDDRYVIDDTDPDHLASASWFGLLVRSLISDASEAARVQMTLPSWMDFMSAFISSYVKPHSEDDDRVLRRCLAEVSSLGKMSMGGRKVRYSVAQQLLRSKIASLSGKRGQYLVDGVVVSSFLPMRAIPFEIIFVAGLGANQFPRKDVHDPLDLKAPGRAGEVRCGDEDKYLFLETLLCARRKIFFSHVARDEVTGDEIQPSSVVLELREALERGYVPKKAIDIRRFPLHRYDDPALRRISQKATAEEAARRMGESLRRTLEKGRLPDATELRSSLPSEVSAALGLAPLPEPSRLHPKSLSLSLSTLRQFLECPLQGSARLRLRTRDSEWEDLLDREDENFAIGPLDRAMLLREVFRRGASRTVYDEVSERFELRGAGALGTFGDAEREQHLRILEAWRGALGNVMELGEVSFENAREEPFVLTPDDRRIELFGSNELRVVEPRATLRLLTQSRERFHARRESLRGFLDHVFRCAGAESGEPTFFLAINVRPGQASASLEVFRFAAIEPARAVAYLNGLVLELLAGIHDYLLPCEAVFHGGQLLAPEKTSSRFGPVAHPEDYATPAEAEIRAMTARRFGLYFSSIEELEGDVPLNGRGLTK